MDDTIKGNLTYLGKYISNLLEILAELVQADIISSNECEEIENEKTTFTKNFKLLKILLAKDLDQQGRGDVILEIFRKTNNQHCANIIESTNVQKERNRYNQQRVKKWLPEKKYLKQYLYKRKIDGKLLVEKLHEIITTGDNRKVAICESEEASKYSGFGGVGKTVTAKWYAQHYKAEYDHIIWIDCGEGSLLKSFKILARDLNLKDRKQFVDLEDFSRESFKSLSKRKCLWIFDNVESYLGQDGIQKVLPQGQKNFYCLITARKWTSINTGYAKISCFPLKMFSDEESLEFTEAQIDPTLVRDKEYQLKALCRLLSNLPLALQLAVAAINNGKINLEEYIENTSFTNLDEIVNKPFDDYERVISNHMTQIFDVISKGKHAVAYDVLMILGYIRPDDISTKFLMTVLKCKIKTLKQAIDLLEKYSLVTETGKTEEFPYDKGFVNKLFRWNKIKESMPVLSTHRLLQQVIRHNARKNENQILRKILGCDSFLEYKLFPFTRYASEKIQHEFPEIRAQLDEVLIKNLLRENRSEEAVSLAKFINEDLKTNGNDDNKQISNYNLAVCLEKDGQLDKCIEILEILYGIVLNDEGAYALQSGLMHMETELSKDFVAGLLFLVSWRMGKTKRAKEILDEAKILKIYHSNETLLTLLDIFNTVRGNYSILSKYSVITLQLHGCANCIELYDCYFDLQSSQFITEDLHELKLDSIKNEKWEMNNNNIFELRNWIPKQLNRLTIISTTCQLSLDELSSIEYLTLKNCSLNVNSISKLSPIELELEDVDFISDHQNTLINSFIDFRKKLKRLTINFEPEIKNWKWVLDIGENLSFEYVWLRNVNVSNWNEAKWKITKLTLVDIPFIEQTQMQLDKLECYNNLVDPAHLPKTIKSLSLINAEISCSCSERPNLPNLRHLMLENVDIQSLAYFKSVNLKQIHFNLMAKVNMDLLPDSIEKVKISKHMNDMKIYGGPRSVDKLILVGLSSEKVKKVLGHLVPIKLCLSNNYKPTKELIVLMTDCTHISIIVCGRVQWHEDFEMSVLSKFVDKISEFYFFAKGENSGRIGFAIEEQDFQTHNNF